MAISVNPPITPSAAVVSVLVPETAVATDDSVLLSIVRLSEFVVAPVFATVMVTAESSKVLEIAPVRLFCVLTKAKTGAVVAPIVAADAVNAAVPLAAVAMDVRRLLLAATELSVSVPTVTSTVVDFVAAVTAPELVWLCTIP